MRVQVKVNDEGMNRSQSNIPTGFKRTRMCVF